MEQMRIEPYNNTKDQKRLANEQLLWMDTSKRYLRSNEFIAPKNLAAEALLNSSTAQSHYRGL